MTARTYGITLTSTGDLPAVAQRVRLDTVEQIAQRIGVKLKTHRGEWLPDRRVGMPYYTWGTTKPAPVDLVVQTMTSAIEEVPGVVSVVLSGSFNASTRTIIITGTVIATEGQITISYTAPVAAGDPPRYEWIGGAFSGGS